MDLERIIYVLPAIIVGLTVHECAHAWTAYKLGDSTAKDMGRISLNPIKHIDWIGFVFLLIAGFGWAKPVIFNRHNLKKPRRDEILIAIAGPISNLLLSLLFVVVLQLCRDFIPTFAFYLLFYGIIINFVLFIFNMIPIPPLDGSHVIFRFFNIPENWELKISKYGMFALMAVLLLSSAAKIEILPLSKAVNWYVDLLVK